MTEETEENDVPENCIAKTDINNSVLNGFTKISDKHISARASFKNKEKMREIICQFHENLDISTIKSGYYSNFNVRKRQLIQCIKNRISIFTGKIRLKWQKLKKMILTLRK